MSGYSEASSEKWIRRKNSPQGGYNLTNQNFSLFDTIDIVQLGAEGWTSHSLTFTVSPSTATAITTAAPGHLKLFGFRSGKRFFLSQFMFTAPYDIPTLEWSETLDLIQIWGELFRPSATTQTVNMTYAYVVVP